MMTAVMERAERAAPYMAEKSGHPFEDLLRSKLGEQTLAKFAQRIGMSQSWVSYRLSTPGLPPPPIETVKQIAERLSDPVGIWLHAAYPDLFEKTEPSEQPARITLYADGLDPEDRRLVEEQAQALIDSLRRRKDRPE